MVNTCGILPCDLTKNYCIAGACVDKNTIYWGIAGIVSLVIIIKMTKR